MASIGILNSSAVMMTGFMMLCKDPTLILQGGVFTRGSCGSEELVWVSLPFLKMTAEHNSAARSLEYPLTHGIIMT